MPILEKLRRKRAPRAGTPADDLGWVDEWIGNARDHIFVREVDRLLIKRPNEARKLNAWGARVLRALWEGHPIAAVRQAVGGDPRRERELALFLLEVRRYVDGEPEDPPPGPAIEVERFDLGFSRLPVLSEVAVTYRCNLRCRFCYAGCNCTANPTGDDREMTAAEIRRVLDRIWSEAQVPSVSFTGGEATLRRDLPELIAHAKRLGLRVNLISNGVLIDDALAGRLAASGLDSAQISLEGASAGVHEQVTGVPGSFARSLAAVHRLAERGVHVHTNTTINRINLADGVAMPRLVATELDIDRLSMNLVIPTGSAALDSRLVVPYREIGDHLLAIAAACKEHHVEFMWYSPTPMCLFNPIAHGLGNKGCSACDGLLSVAANGEVLPCASYDDPVGSLLDRPFGEIWSSAAARAYRRKAHAPPGCRSCEDFAVCNGACPLYWRHVGTGELQAACPEGGAS